MTSFAPPAARPRAAALDVHKHVNYTLGMVLGVDDFTQEFAYLSGRDQLLARGLHGYGTVCGLAVTVEPRDDDIQRLANPGITVAPGLAVTPQGQLVSVALAQCAQLVDWLAANRERVEERVTTGDLQLYLVLCYRECATDMVPIPGEPCRSEDEAMAASRIADDFRLDLRFEPPDQREEDALRDFVDWLGQVPIADVSDAGSASPPADQFTPLPDFEDALRAAAEWLGSPPSPPPDTMFGSPPSDLRIPADESCEYLRAAFRIWTTELRPRWLGIGASCAGTPPDEECVLLAELTVPLAGGALDGEVLIDETRRPYLLHLRMLQEWLLCRRHGAEPSDSVVPATEFGLDPDPGLSARYSRADHSHGSPVLGGDVVGEAGAAEVVGLREIPIVYDADGPQDGQVLTFVAESEGGSWQPVDPPTGGGGVGSLDGDVTGAPAETTVSRLQRQPLNAPEPQPGQVLTFVGVDGGGEWQAADPPSGGITSLDGDVAGLANDTTVNRLQRVPLDAPEPQPGQVLTFQQDGDGEGRWVAADVPRGEPTAGDFVEHPPDAGPYLIVAAGVVRGSGNRRSNVYNGLVARVIESGRVLLSFDKYAMPDTFMYIVKALPIFNDRTRDMLNFIPPIVTFDQFTEEGFILFVAHNNQPLEEGILARLELMVEVSQYEFRQQ